ncbi:Anthocyanin 5-aromatic acyltransferase [Forsythia ovata]|uniref:Anthocyanin 5-aromatic acyltransferase n=1 Tax=Forsythia ovata TaxID=205694 RepID=A0ABD1RZM2_9LAMI
MRGCGRGGHSQCPHVLIILSVKFNLLGSIPMTTLLEQCEIQPPHGEAWALINKFNGESQFIEGNSLPLYDRSVIKDPRGIANIYWNKLKIVKLQSLSLHLPISKVRATYILHEAGKKKLSIGLKTSWLKQQLVTAGACNVCTKYLIKSGPASGEEVDTDEPEYFGFAADG